MFHMRPLRKCGEPQQNRSSYHYLNQAGSTTFQRKYLFPLTALATLCMQPLHKREEVQHNSSSFRYAGSILVNLLAYCQFFWNDLKNWC